MNKSKFKTKTLKFEVCKRCYMPNTRPQTGFKNGICQACINHDIRKKVHWKERWKQLEEICDKYRKNDGKYDVLIPVSGGKDSMYMVYVMKEIMKMNPLLLTVTDVFGKTSSGIHNFNNIFEVFNVDKIVYTISPDFDKKIIRYCFENWADPLRYTEQLIQVFPFKMAVDLGISLILRGEDNFIYGSLDKERISTENSDIKDSFSTYSVDFW